MKVIIKSILITAVVFYWTIARHEGSHALLAWLEGAEIYKLSLIPGIHEELGFYFAFVSHDGKTSWLTEAAPFFADVLVLIFGILILRRYYGSRFYTWILWLGIISPMIDLVYNYQGGLWREGTDVADLLEALPDLMVHIAYLSAILSALAALIFFTKRRLKLLKTRSDIIVSNP